MSYGLLNCHSEHSLNQSVSHIVDMVLKAKEVNASHIALTDINTMTGCIQFIETCGFSGVTPIVACELSIHDGQYTYNPVFMAKNYKGYQNLCSIITEANRKLVDSEEVTPYLSYSELETIIDKDNVLVTTGGSHGIIGTVLLQNSILNQKIARIRTDMQKYDSPQDPAYIKNKEIIEKNEKIFEVLSSRKNILSRLASKKFQHKQKGIEAYKGTDRYETELNKLAEEMEQSNLSKIELDEITQEIASLKRTNTIIRKKIRQMEDNHGKYRILFEQLKELESHVYEQDKLMQLCKDIIQKYKNLMGDNFFIQLSADGSQAGKSLVRDCISLATATSTKFYVTCVSYMTNKGEETAVQFMRSLENNEWIELEDGQKKQYIMSLEETQSLLQEYLSLEELKEATETNSDICNMISFEMPKEKHYPKYRDADGRVVEDSANELRKAAVNGIRKRGLLAQSLKDEYKKRLKYELEVIISMGFSDYLLIVADFIHFAKNYVIEKTESHIGYAIGPGRGSAAGSLVCYFLGITNIDPLLYNLKFERFLNVARVTMPDIDVDFSEEIRPATIEYVKNKYGKDSVSLIRTVLTQKANATIRNSARLHGIKKYGQKQKFAGVADKLCALLPKDMELKKCEEQLTEPFKQEPLYQDIKDIVHDAKITEGMITTLGVHPAGVIIGDGNQLQSYVPLLYNKELQQWEVQCDKDEAERIGLLKMDFLVVKNLDKLTETIRRIKKYTGETVDLDNIPFNKEVFTELYSKGKTMSVFQFESAGMRKMLQDFKPQCFEDIILLIAAYRPGPMDSIPDIIAVKNGKKKPKYCIPELEPILKQTYGYPIYQEQLMDIFSKCAGFSQEEADIIRRYMSKKKTKEFVSYKEPFIKGIIEHGATKKEAEELWDSLVQFSEYAFNKSHACAYALVSYMTAYLKYYYGEYYMCAVLNHSEQSKYGSLLYECQNMGISVYLPSINESYNDFENTSKGIRFGLGKIKNFSSSSVNKIITERTVNGRYTSFKNFLVHTSCTENTIKTLIYAGAFDDFCECSREQKIQSLSALICMKEQILKIEKLIQKESENKTKLQILNREYAIATSDFDSYTYADIAEESSEILQNEKSLLGAYISSHPLSKYEGIYIGSGIKKIVDIDEGEQIIIGIIKNIKHTKRKKDGKDMAFFELEDISDSIDVCCFVAEYQKYGEQIFDGNIVMLSGKCTIEDSDQDSIKKFIVTKIEKCRQKKEPMFVSIRSKNEEAMAYYALKPYEAEGGHDILLHYQDTGYIERKKMSVSKKALSLNSERIFLKIFSKK